MSNTTDNHTESEDFMTNLVTLFENWNFIPTFLAIFINTFHVFILSKKSVTSSAVNSILLGIGVVDIFSPLIYIKIAVHNSINSRNCVLPDTHLETIIDWVFTLIRDNFRRCSVWLGLCLAVIRSISLKMATRKNFNVINEAKTGRILVVTVLLISTIFSISFTFRYHIVGHLEPWIPGKECLELSVLPNHIHWEISEIPISDSFFQKYAREVHLVLTAVFGKIIPSILFPISAILLIFEFRKARKLQTTQNRQHDKTNRLVVYMTITFIVIEFPIGICKLVTATRADFEEAIIPEGISKILNTIYVSVTTSHFFICYKMSAEYRRTVKNVFLSTENIGSRIFNKFSNG